MDLLPVIFTAIFAALLLIGLVRDWLTYRKLRKTGQLSQVGVTGNVSADVLATLLGLGVAWGSNYLVVSLLNRRSWPVPEWMLFAFSFGVSLAVVIITGKLYARYADGRVRRFLLTESQDGGIE